MILLDISFCSSGLFWSLTCHTLNETHGSDHFPIVIEYSNTNISHDKDQTHKEDFASFCLSKADWGSFSKNLSSKLSSFSFSNSILVTYDDFIGTIFKVTFNHIPSNTKYRSQFKTFPI